MAFVIFLVVAWLVHEPHGDGWEIARVAIIIAPVTVLSHGALYCVEISYFRAELRLYLRRMWPNGCSIAPTAATTCGP